jgi:hypothetical protein
MNGSPRPAVNMIGPPTQRYQRSSCAPLLLSDVGAVLPAHGPRLLPEPRFGEPGRRSSSSFNVGFFSHIPVSAVVLESICSHAVQGGL